jgi:hypothetical protein
MQAICHLNGPSFIDCILKQVSRMPRKKASATESKDTVATVSEAAAVPKDMRMERPPDFSPPASLFLSQWFHLLTSL